MKVKLDQNLGAMGAVFLKAAGFDAATVADQTWIKVTSFVIALAVLVAVAIAACALPVRRAAAIGPVEALRGE